MNPIETARKAIQRRSRLRELKANADFIITEVAEFDLRRIPKIWVKEADRIVVEQYEDYGEKFTDSSAALLKLGLFCRSYEKVGDEISRKGAAVAIHKLRISNPGRDILKEISRFCYSYANE